MMGTTNNVGGGAKGAMTPWLSAIRAILFLALEWGKQTWHVPARR